MRIFYVLYFTSITYLLAVTMPEFQGRWSSLCNNILSLIHHIRSSTSAAFLFAIATDPPSAAGPFSSMGGIDVCRVSTFGIDDTCHPFDAPIAYTPTLIFNTPATRTVSAIAAAPVAYNLVPYKDMFFMQPEIEIGLRKSKGSNSRQGGIPSNVEPIHILDLLSSAVSTLIIVQLLMVRKVAFGSQLL